MIRTPSIYSLIAEYWTRYEALAIAMHLTDNTALQTKERSEAECVQTKACNHLDAAAIAVCEFVPTWRIDAQIKHDFVQSLASRNGELTTQETAALIASTAGLFSASGRAAA